MSLKPDCTLNLFHDRLEKALPGVSGFKVLKSDHEITSLLEILIRPVDSSDDGCVPDSLWWFRGGRSLPVRQLKVLGEQRYLIGFEEILVSETIVYVNRTNPELSFVYLSCDPLPGLNYNQRDIKRQVRRHGFAIEELAYIPEYDLYVSASYLDYGEPVEIDGQLVMPTEERARYISPYNLFIAPKESKLNNTGYLTGGELLEAACNKLLSGELNIQDFPEFLDKFATCRFREGLLTGRFL